MMLRRWTGIVIAMSAVVMIVTGAALLGWHEETGPRSSTVAGLDYVSWGELHLVSSVMFVFGAISHVRLNLRPLLAHFGSLPKG